MKPRYAYFIEIPYCYTIEHIISRYSGSNGVYGMVCNSLFDIYGGHHHFLLEKARSFGDSKVHRELSGFICAHIAN